MTDATVERRRRAVAAAWDLRDEIVLVGAGHEATMPGRGDQAHPFRGHPEYVWLTDLEGPFRVLAFDPGEGWTDFAPAPTPEEAVWSEPGEPGDAPLPDLEAWLEARGGRPLALLGDAPGVPGGDEALASRLRSQMAELRLIKDDVELERMRAAARATAAGYEAARKVVRPGVTERRVQVELEAGFGRAGGDRLAYDTIVASGPRAAVLHALPSRRVLGGDELVLVDAGTEVRFYAADVTRTWPVGGELSSRQREIYDLVLEAQMAAVKACRPGTGYGEVHRRASLVLTAGMVALGILRGDAEELLQEGVQTLFFPHGVGHPVGLGVRGAGPQIQPAGSGPPPPGSLRVEFTLRPGCTVTVEPGLYFHPALLQDPDRRRRYGDRVDWDRALDLVALGGVRIEDNVHVTGDEPEVLTAAIPKRL